MHGYSSSEESDDPRRPRVQPANDNNQNQKKKRKKRVPPQKSINAVWKKFSSRNFNKALCILPFDPVAPAASNQPNELLSQGYERAADECRRKVFKIVQECKRVNMRYRDPGWDLDFDLKFSKGECLNSLGDQKFALTQSNLLGSSASVPKAVKRVHQIFDNPVFMKEVNGGDVIQGSLGDCWLMAGLTALSTIQDGVRRLCVAHDQKIGIYGFVFYRDGDWVYSIVDDKLYLKSPCWDCPSMQRDLLQQIDREDVENVYRKTYQTGSKALFFAQCKNQDETWVPLMEKAYAKAHGDYACLSGGYVGEAIEDLSGGVTTELLSSDILDTDEFWEKELSKATQEFLFGCSTGLLEHGYGQRDGIREAHAYGVLETRTLKSGERLVKLRNPWGKIGKGVWEGPWSDGSKEWSIDARNEIGHDFAQDAVFWISYADLLKKFTHFDRTRLFTDQDWRCCQRWIGVDVPWESRFYHEKFRIRLTKSSPLVLALSQLDGRYFKGLAGQYVFRINFRLHNQDTPGAEDYIVRSHGNYFMKRSVAVEVPDLPAGDYVVYLKVTGQRDGDAPSVEDVVKRECKARENNEKFRAVACAYDLAHSKAWAHVGKVASLRKKRDQYKASRCRQEERRRLWEKRHLTRQIKKTQTSKNNEKRERRARGGEGSEPRSPGGRRAGERQDGTQTISRGTDTADAADATARAKSSDANASDSSGSPHDTPKTEDSVVLVSGEKRQDVPPIGGPPPAPRHATAPARETKDESAGSRRPRRPRDESDGASSDSPIEDWEELYSSDDLTRKPRTAPHHARQPRDDYDSEEKMADPWNAVCIVGIRVYSKDEELQLQTVMEGGELLEDCMGEKGAEDLDNAQANAAGVRADEAKDDVGPLLIHTKRLSIAG